MSKRNSERIGSNCGSTGRMICSSRCQNIRGKSKVACNDRKVVIRKYSRRALRLGS